MGNDVFANGREVSCKAADGKSICAFPDVCFTPPENPATPPGVPIPYPNTGMASDMTSGSKNVKISNKEVILKNKSYFKKSTGDEAGSAAKKGVVTSTNRGKVYFNSWSMDVKFEGENVVRHLDLTTHNHASAPGGTPPQAYMDMPVKLRDKCLAQDQDEKEKCEGATPHMVPDSKGKMVQKGLDCPDGCKEAKACILASKKHDEQYCCEPDITGHHLIEVHCFTHVGARGERSDQGPKLDEYLDYRENEAPCVCASKSASDGTHGTMHDLQGKHERGYAGLRSADPNYEPYEFGGHPLERSYWTYGEARDTGAMAHNKAFPECESECTKRQLDWYHQDQLGISEDAPLRSDTVNRH
jgi:Toxin PAAR-like domain/GHH signature containing HNH/Endo VII superfamily nuclease toxin  2